MEAKTGYYVIMENNKKPTNPKDVLGIAKVPMHCVPARVLMELGLAMAEGGRKYGTYNYRNMGVRSSVYYDAAVRHLMDWWEGTDIDPDSGLHHVTKAIASLVVLRDGMLMENIFDDRPIQLPNKLNLEELNQLSQDLIKKYPKCAKPFTQGDAYPGIPQALRFDDDDDEECEKGGIG